jgi:hypothetical protein
MKSNAELRLTKRSRCGTEGKGKKPTCLGLPDAIALEREQGNHIPSPGGSLRQGEVLRGPVQWCRECGPVS